MENSNSFLKWVGGIISAIVAGVVIWWLTGVNSPFVSGNQSTSGQSTSNHPIDPGSTNPDPAVIVPKGPKVVITMFNLKNPINIGETITAEFEVENEGDAVSNGCQLIWETPGLNGSKTSEQFDLQPGEKKSIELVSNIFDKQGTFSTNARLTCGNTETITETKDVIVNFMMNRKPLTQ